MMGDARSPLGWNSMISYARKAPPNAPGRQELILPGCDSGSVLVYTKNAGVAEPASSSHDLAGPGCK